MKYAVVAAFFFCAALVSAGYGDDDSEYNPLSEESERSEEIEEAVAACQLGLLGCLTLVEKYQASGIYETAETVRKAGLRAVCRDVNELNECAVEVLTDVCPPDFSLLFVKAHAASNLICVDKIDDIEHHWDCLLNVEIDKNLEHCQQFESSLERCETSDFIQCINGTFSASPKCKPGATELVSQIIDKIVAIMPQCPERHHFKRLVLNFLKK